MAARSIGRRDARAPAFIRRRASSVFYLIDEIMALGDPAPGRAFCDFTRLSSSALYSGPLLDVERVTGGSIASIGTAGPDLNQGDIASHCGASLGRVSTRYDQSGNGRHESQSTASERPQIWDGSAVLTAGVAGRPAMAFNRAANQSLGGAGYLSGAGAYTIFYMGRSTATGNKTWTTHSPLRFGSTGSTLMEYLGAGSQFRTYTPLTPITTLASYISTFAAGTDHRSVPLEQNGSNLAQAAVAGAAVTVTFTTTDMRSGDETDGAGSLGLDGVLPCMIEWGVQLSAGSLALLRAFGAGNI